MSYESTVTSKGTITLPSAIRRKLGVGEGDKVSIELQGDVIKVQPRAGWDEMFAVADEIQRTLKKRGRALPRDVTALRDEADKIKTAEYRKKYLENTDA